MDSRQIRIVYMGTPEFAVEPLRRLVETGYRVVAVVTVPDKPAGRGLMLHQSAVKQYALQQGIPVYQPEKLKDPEWVETFRCLEPDLAVVVAFRMLPEVIWAMPKLGTFNLHTSLLPQYRGAAPINWAVINGDTESGVTTFFLNHEIDCGAIIGQRRVPITETDTAGTLHDKLMTVGADLVTDTVDAIAAGTVLPLPQQTHEGGLRGAPKIFKEDCEIDWNNDVVAVYNKIRGLSPYPAAWCRFDDTTAKILTVSHEKAEPKNQPGIFETDGKKELKVACRNGYIRIERLQLAGKKAMDTPDFLRGYRLKG